MIRWILQLFESRTFGAKRSSSWSRVRKMWLAEHPECAVCGVKRGLEVHHLIPFHMNPDLELEPDNMITLCQGFLTRNHHLEFGHLGSWRSWNGSVEKDARIWSDKIKNRP